MAPPPKLDPRWLRVHAAYTVSKYGMSLSTLGMASEFSGRVAVNGPLAAHRNRHRAINMLGARVQAENCRTPAIVADVAWSILTRDHKTCSSQFFLDEEVLREEGVRDFTSHAVKVGAGLEPDLFLS